MPNSAEQKRDVWFQSLPHAEQQKAVGLLRQMTEEERTKAIAGLDSTLAIPVPKVPAPQPVVSPPPPQEPPQRGFLQQAVVEPARTFGSGLYAAAASTAQALQGGVELLDFTGLGRGDAFGRAAKQYQRISEELGEKGIPGGITKALYGGLGQLSFDLPQIMALGLPTYMTAKSGGLAAAEGKRGKKLLAAAGKGGLEGLALHYTLGLGKYLPRGGAAAFGGALFGGLTLIEELSKPEGEVDWDNVFAQFGIGVMLSVGGRKVPGKQFIDTLRREYRKPKKQFVKTLKKKGVSEENAAKFYDTLEQMEALSSDVSKGKLAQPDLKTGLPTVEELRAKKPVVAKPEIKKPVAGKPKKLQQGKVKTLWDKLPLVVQETTHPYGIPLLKKTGDITKLSNKDLKTLINHAESWYTSTSPTTSRVGEKLYEKLTKELSARSKVKPKPVQQELPLSDLQKRGTTRQGDVHVKIVQHSSGGGFAVETTVKGDRRLPTEAAMSLEQAQKFAVKQLTVPRKISVPTKSIVKAKKPKTAKVAPLNPADFAAELKGLGVGRKESWSRWVQRTALKPEMDAKDWFKIYDSVTATRPIKSAQRELPLQTLQDEYAALAQKEASQSIHFTDKHRARMEKLTGEITKRIETEVKLKPAEGGFLGGKKEVRPVFTGTAKKVDQMYDRAVEATKRQNKLTVRKVHRALKKRFVDVSGNVKQALAKFGPEGREVVMNHELLAGGSPKAHRDYDVVAKDIWGDLTSTQRDFLARSIQSVRTTEIGRYKQIKHPEGLGPEEHKAFLDALPQEVKDVIDPRRARYFAEYERIVDRYLKEGIVTKEGAKSLKEFKYSPRQFLQHIDPDVQYSFGGRKITVPSSGIKKLEEGSEKLLELDPQKHLRESMVRAETRIFRNRANRVAYEFAKTHPDNGIFVIPEGKGKAPAGFEKISVMIDGKPKEFFMPWDMAKEWVKNDPALDASLANILGWISGAKILRAMATGHNPEFVISNMPLDIITLWLSTSEHAKPIYSGFLPKFLGQIGKDLKEVRSDAFHRKGLFNTYIKHGGYMEFLTGQGTIGKELHGPLKAISEVTSYAGNTSEIWVRLAAMNRAMKQGYSEQEAVWIARRYIDFFQGGNYTKAVDTVWPYLNAAAQGMRVNVRAAKTNPKEYTMRMAQLGLASMGIYYANRYVNKEAMEMIPGYAKDGYWVFTTPFSRIDENGEKRYKYFRIRKDQTVRPIAAVFDAVAAMSVGDPVDVDRVVESVKDVMRLGPFENLPPALAAYWSYKMNRNIWTNKDIWTRGKHVKAWRQWDDYTHPAFKVVGKVGLSPKKTQEALKSIFTSGNLWTAAAGIGWKQIFDTMSDEEQSTATEELLVNQPFVRRLLRETQPSLKGKKGREKIRGEAATKQLIQTQDFDGLVWAYLKDETKKEAVSEYIKAAPPGDRERLRSRVRRAQKLQDLPNRSWWLDLEELPPKPRAMVYYIRHKGLSEKERAELWATSKKAPGVNSKDFRAYLGIIAKKDK